MRFFRNILGRTADEPEVPAAPEVTGPDPVLAALAELEIRRLREALAAANPEKLDARDADESLSARPNRVVRAKAPLPEGVKGPAVNIWDLEDDGIPLAGMPAAADRPPRSRTRVLGFEGASADGHPQADIVSLFEPEVPAAAKPVPSQKFVMFPVGWLVVKSGPGQGSVFSLAQGVSQIGRGTDQTVALDFGDMSISRQNHAAIAYDSLTHQFHIGHGGKSNLVRLNGKPLLSTEVFADGDEVQIGETTLLLKVLCTPAFNWSETEAKGDGHDMAIA